MHKRKFESFLSVTILLVLTSLFLFMEDGVSDLDRKSVV